MTHKNMHRHMCMTHEYVDDIAIDQTHESIQTIHGMTNESIHTRI
jgi:hypothetical protein